MTNFDDNFYNFDNFGDDDHKVQRDSSQVPEVSHCEDNIDIFDGIFFTILTILVIMTWTIMKYKGTVLRYLKFRIVRTILTNFDDNLYNFYNFGDDDHKVLREVLRYLKLDIVMTFFAVVMMMMMLIITVVMMVMAMLTSLGMVKLSRVR